MNNFSGKVFIPSYLTVGDAQLIAIVLKCLLKETFIPKRYEVKECATNVIDSPKLKFKECNLIDASLYTYLCIAICMSIYIL